MAKEKDQAEPAPGEKKKFRSKIEESIEKAQEAHRRESFLKRLELARQGLRDYEKHRLGEAAKAFHMYLKILEDWKKIGEGELSPAHFDRQKDSAELVLISGIYWDLAKLYDRTKSQRRQKEFKIFLDKFVLFSKNTTYEGVSAETLRKYIALGKPLHKKEFADAYTKMKGKGCFVATSLADHLEPGVLRRLRSFRDEVLETNSWGRRVVAAYYRVGPRISDCLDRTPESVRAQAAKGVSFVEKVISKWSRFSRDGS